MEGMPGYSDLYVHLGHRGGHWSSSMKSFSARSSRTLNPLSCDCERHIDCSWSFSLECSGVVLFFDVRPWCCILIYILHHVILHFIKHLLV